MRKRKIFWASLVFSIFFHLGMLIFLITHFSLLDSSYFSLQEDAFTDTVSENVIDFIFAEDKNMGTKESLIPQKQADVLPKIVAFSTENILEPPRDMPKITAQPAISYIDSTTHPVKKAPIDPEDRYADWMEQLQSLQYPKNPVEKQDIVQKLTAQKEPSPAFFYRKQYMLNEKLPQKESSLAQFFAKIHDTLVYKMISGNLTAQKRAVRFLPLVPILPTMEELKTFSGHQDFDMDVRYVQSEGKYVFALTLIPKSDHQFEKIPQYFTFLFDRSNSIENRRFNETRHALASALHHIDTDFHFNIIAFDNRCDFLSSAAHVSNNTSKKLAKKFLFSQNLGSFLVAKNYMTPLSALFSQKIEKGAIHNAIFLTNGEELHKMKNFRLMQNWTNTNRGDISLFTIAKSGDKNRLLLEMFSNLNKGQLISTRTDRGIKRQLIKLIKSLSYPVAKDIQVSTTAIKSNADITLFHPANGGDLYMDQPLVIIGTTDSLEDFYLMIQGKNKNRWFNIKKKITLKNAEKGGESLHKRWAIIQAYGLYQQYLSDNNPEHLQKARTLLQPFGLDSAL